MSVVRLAGRTLLVAALAAATATCSASPAFGLSAWWHLTSGTQPSVLQTNAQSGLARNEVQEIVAPLGEYEGEKVAGFAMRLEGHEYEFVTQPFAAKFDLPEPTAAAVQKVLEEAAPGHSWRVAGGPAGAEPLRVTSEGSAPALQISSFGLNTTAHGKVLSEGRADGVVSVTVTNVGDAPSGEDAQIVDRLPRGLRAVSIEDKNISGGVGAGGAALGVCRLATLTCSGLPPVKIYGAVEVRIGVVVESPPVPGEVNGVTAFGGEAPSKSTARPVRVGDEASAFGIEEYQLTPEEEGGGPDTQAGSHPFQLTSTLMLNQVPVENSGYPVALPKDLRFTLPAGLIGNPTVLPQCTLKQFLTTIGQHNECPPQTAIGMASTTIYVDVYGIGTARFVEPLFNLEPAVGEPARFGFYVIILGGSVPVILNTAVRTGGDYGVTVDVNDITEDVGVESSTVTFWGVPGDARHDSARGWSCLTGEGPCAPLEEEHPPPFLSMPTMCAGALQSSVEADSWEAEGVFGALQSDPMPALDGCNRLPFTPSIKVTPDGQAGSTPTGLNVDEHVSQLSTLAPKGLAESDAKEISVTLPEGVALNPAAADGLMACTQEAIGLQDDEAPGCPEAAKVATMKIRTPLLPEALEGAAYLATQDTNPFGSLVALYLFAEDPIAGVRVKAAGEVVENPVTGQLTAHFEGDPLFAGDSAYADDEAAKFLPPLPYEDVELHFFGGDRAPLVTPAKCGSYTTQSVVTPWSGNPPVESASTFDVTSGPNGSPCTSPLPFAPTLTTGTTSIQAGGFSPFAMTMSREDGEQTLQGVSLHMPPGVSGTLSTVKLCGEEQANTGTCGPESEIGETVVSVGVGGDPFTVKGGKVYITGPYRGAPFGLSIVNPAKAGPFDLGKVVVRAKLEVNEETAAITVTTDDEGSYKIPTIIDGIPLEIKHVYVNINRPGFTFNATNCSPLQITGSLTSTEGATSTLSVPYQVTNCAVLAFKPQLEASTSGKASRANGASFRVKLGYPAGPYDANIARVKVELPKALPSRLTTLQKACTAAVFESNPAACPPASIVGQATAKTPVLPVPLSGPAYFVSHGGEAFPSLVIVLQGYGVTIHLVGSTFINKAGITSSTFKAVPDVPVGTFELTLPQGPYSALAANGNLCKKGLAMPTEFVGQNGALLETSTKIAVTSCGKTKKSSHKKKLRTKGKHRKK